MLGSIFQRVLPFVVVTALLVGGANPAAAHETREVGPYEFVVGWGEEPTYTTFKNEVQLTLTHAGSGKPVLDLKGKLDVEVSFDDASTTLPMEPAFVPGSFGEPGVFTASLTPTRPGKYTFRFVGDIGTTEIDEEFTSGPNTFGSPVDVKETEFPAKDPTAGELAQSLDDVERSATDDASAARLLAIVSLALGLAALVAAAFALRATRARS